MSEPLKVLELFAGIGACSKALTNLGIEHEIVDAVEIDKYAIKSFNAIHGTSFEPQDITKWDKDIECDLIMHGSPCQDFSVAGKQAGGDKDSGTRSSLMYETLRIVEKLQPKYVIWENVKNLLSKKHQQNYFAYIEAMAKLGYKSYGRVLNAKDFGVPQNRERVYTVSTKQREREFKFPEPKPLERKLGDMLEANVDEKYFLSDQRVEGLIRHNKNHEQKGTGFLWEPRNTEGVASCLRANAALCATDNTVVDGIVKIGDLDMKGIEQIRRVYSPEGCCPTISTMQGGNRQPKIVASRGRGETNEQNLEARKDGLTNTLTSVQKDNYVSLDCRIRKLTPKECWRLMGFDDEDFERAAKENSNTQLYKQAGNSIVVDVLEGILTNLLKEVE